MSPRPMTAPALPPSRPNMLAASFAGCGLFLLILFATLVGCTTDYRPFVSAPYDAILCHCECPSPVGPNAVPSQNPIAAGEDDAVQGSTQTTAVLNANQLELGLNNSVGLRFQPLNIPKGATITSAVIQFTAVQAATEATALSIRVVPNAAPFTTATDLTALTGISASSPWTPGAWADDEAGANEQTPDLTDLLKPIVQDPQYNPNSAVAFIITGSGHRVARSFEGSMTTPQPALLTVEYLPKPPQQDFLTCGDPADPAVCGGYVLTTVNAIATACLLVATQCTCTKSGADPSTFSQVCNSPCPAILLPPADCDPEHTALTTSQTPVCVSFGP